MIKPNNRPCGRRKKRKTYNRPSVGENHTAAPLARGNAPLLPPAAASFHGKASHTILTRPRAPYESCSLATPEGQICSSLTPCANLSCSLYSGKKSSPSGGKVVHSTKRGAFPSGEARFACFPFAPRVRLFGFIIRGGLLYFKCRPPLPQAALGSFLRWQSCIGLPSRAKLALRRVA